jgi:hypothetical protein
MALGAEQTFGFAPMIYSIVCLSLALYTLWYTKPGDTRVLFAAEVCIFSNLIWLTSCGPLGFVTSRVGVVAGLPAVSRT